MIKNFKRDRIAPCSYDFRLGEIFKQEKVPIIDTSKGKKPKLTKLKLPYILKPGEYIIGRTFEEVNIPLDLMAIYSTRSLAYRLGLNIMCGIGSPNNKGKIVFGIHNISQNRVKVFEDLELLQATFVELKGDPVSVESRFVGDKLL